MQSFKEYKGEIKKAFLSNQCKDIEENSKMGTNGDLFKKVEDTKATFLARKGMIKNRNGET